MSHTLLISDDERHIREGILLSCDWESLGIHTVYTASNGVQALELFEQHRIDILLSDIVMPEMDGLELCRQVHQRYKSTLIYLLTGYGDFEYAREAMRNGVTDYILKPVDDAELTAAMRGACQLLDSRKSRKRKIENWEQELKLSLPDEAQRTLHAFVEDALSDWDSLPKKQEAFPVPSNPTIQKILRYVEENISNEQISLSFIADKHLFLNAHYLGKLFKKEMGVKFSTYLLDRRIDHAIAYIQAHPGAKVYEIAAESGFASNPNYFSTLFHRVTGRSPTEYLGK